MAAIQEISGTIGRTTGRSRWQHPAPAWLLNTIVGLLFIANTIPACISQDFRSSRSGLPFVKIALVSARDKMPTAYNDPSQPGHPSVLSQTFESSVGANMIHSRDEEEATANRAP